MGNRIVSRMNKKSARRLKSIGKGSLITILALIGFVLCIEIVYIVVIKQRTITGRKEAAFAQRADDVHMLFLGQSDVIRGLNPLEFEVDAFNYSFSGETFIGTYYRLRSRIDKMPKLETIVLPVSYASFSAKRRLAAHSFSFISPWDLVELSQIRGKTVFSRKITETFAAFRQRSVNKMYRKIVELIVLGEIQNKTEMVDGFLIENKSHFNRNNAKKAVDRLLTGANPMDQGLLLYFKKILELCREKNINVVTVSLPMSDYFIELASRHVTMAHIKTAVIDNPEYHQFICAHFDYTNLLSGRNEMFHDQNHLNMAGAAIVSRQLAGDLKNLGI
jgi:hypothetical protein